MKRESVCVCVCNSITLCGVRPLCCFIMQKGTELKTLLAWQWRPERAEGWMSAAGRRGLSPKAAVTSLPFWLIGASTHNTHIANLGENPLFPCAANGRWPSHYRVATSTTPDSFNRNSSKSTQQNRRWRLFLLSLWLLLLLFIIIIIPHILLPSKTWRLHYSECNWTADR